MGILLCGHWPAVVFWTSSIERNRPRRLGIFYLHISSKVTILDPRWRIRIRTQSLIQPDDSDYSVRIIIIESKVENIFGKCY